jgi:hypothetical protein
MRSLVIVTAAALLALGCGSEPPAPTEFVAEFGHMGGGAGHAPDHAPGNFETHLRGENERPNPVETTALGQAKLQVSRDGSEIRFRLLVARIHDPIMAHIHRGGVEEAGPIVVWLRPEGPPAEDPAGRFDGMYAAGTFGAERLVGPLAGGDLSDLVAEMRAGNTYVNVHTTQNPGGEIRGQIRPLN